MGLSNAERQALWRANRAAEIKRLRSKVARDAPEGEFDEHPRPKRRRRGPLSNAERQALWRANRAAELAALRKAAAAASPTKIAPEPDEDPDDRPAHLAVPGRPKRRARYVTEQAANEGLKVAAANMRALMKRWRELPELGRAVDHNWLRSPNPRDVRSLKASLEIIEPAMALAEAWLDAAKRRIGG